MIENILANLKIERLNPMQEASINAWKEGKDLILLSPTGSGEDVSLSVAFGAEFEAWYNRRTGYSAGSFPGTGFTNRPGI
mgnify:CR=1 FL=1